ncbi:MAG: ribosome silencing factor [Oscillospiraceae bacterium]
MNSIDLAKKIETILDEKLAEEVKMIDVDKLTTITDYFVISTAKSSTHVRALRDEVEDVLSKMGIEPLFKEIAASNWVVLDYNSVVLHIFDEETRDFYNLEKLWEDAVVSL